MLKKQFKDPIYGYIDISSDKVAQIIDTPAFQRLKDIRQTSYTPLYPAAYHNRFVHSLGVYHLGQIAFGAIREQLKEIAADTDLADQLDRLQELFELACLLHDVGHAPFSHTGEQFYLDKAGTLYQNLKETVGDEQFSKDFDALGAKPAQHECMSCIVAIRRFPRFFGSREEKSFFSRCIIGMSFRLEGTLGRAEDDMPLEEKKKIWKQRQEYKARKKRTELLNCIISLLNSSIIDVDRLDYVIRDAETIGFQNAQVDYQRLLQGMRILKIDGKRSIGYHKSALSVIESAVYAHDAEKKWIQSHPSILYEMEALKSAMGALTEMFQSEEDPNPVFCFEALTEEGKTLKRQKPLFTPEARLAIQAEKLWSGEALELRRQGKLFAEGRVTSDCRLVQEYPVRLLADEDLLYLLKCFCRDGLGFEYFARDRRRSAVWKSEAEFRALFQKRIGDDTKDIQTLESDFEGLVNYCQKKTGQPIVNGALFKALQQEELEAEEGREEGMLDKEDYEDIMGNVRTNRHWAKILIGLAKTLNLERDFLIIFQKKFSSSFKASLEDIPIYFPNVEGDPVRLGNVIATIAPKGERKSNFFHVFYRAKGDVDDVRKRKIVNTIARGLIDGINSKSR